MEARGLIFALLGVILLTMTLGFTFTDLSTNSAVPQEQLNMETFNQTNAILDMVSEQKNETGFLQDVPILGDVVALVGSSVRALHVMTSVPGIYMNMIADLSAYIGIPPYITLIANAFLWVLLIMIFISAGLRYRT